MRWKEILVEGPSRYEAMLAGLNELLPDEKIYDLSKGHIKYASSILKRQDRIVWYLRWYRLRVLKNTVILKDYEMREPAKNLFQKYCREMGMSDDQFEAEEILVNLKEYEHFLSLNYKPIDDLVWNRQSPKQLFAQLRALEKTWKETRGQIISYEFEDEVPEVFLDVGNAWAWYDLEKAYCSDESEAMGHCGNAGSDGNETILSLRKQVPHMSRSAPRVLSKPQDFRPSLTFILDENGFLGEMKGRGNDKPAPQYHNMIIKLLLDKRIVGIKGGGYLPENNFAMSDLPEDVRKKVYQQKPELKTMDQLWYDLRTQIRVDKVAPDPIDERMFKRKLDYEMSRRGHSYQKIDLLSGNIIIDTWDSVDSYISTNGGKLTVSLRKLFNQLPSILAGANPNLSSRTIDGIANAAYAHEFPKLFDELLSYDNAYHCDVWLRYKNNQVVMGIDISNYLDKVVDQDTDDQYELTGTYDDDISNDIEIYQATPLQTEICKYLIKKTKPDLDLLVKLIVDKYGNRGETTPTINDFRQKKLFK